MISKEGRKERGIHPKASRKINSICTKKSQQYKEVSEKFNPKKRNRHKSHPQTKCTLVINLVSLDLTRCQSVLALGKDTGLLSDLGQSANNLFVAIVESVDRIRNLGLVAEFHNQLLGPSQIVSWNLRIQVVNSLVKC
jgi:hypothetical protein